MATCFRPGLAAEKMGLLVQSVVNQCVVGVLWQAADVPVSYRAIRVPHCQSHVSCKKL